LKAVIFGPLNESLTTVIGVKEDIVPNRSDNLSVVSGVSKSLQDRHVFDVFVILFGGIENIEILSPVRIRLGIKIAPISRKACEFLFNHYLEINGRSAVVVKLSTRVSCYPPCRTSVTILLEPLGERILDCAQYLEFFITRQAVWPWSVHVDPDPNETSAQMVGESVL